jgi:type IV pilus assembly protein PilP
VIAVLAAACSKDAPKTAKTGPAARKPAQAAAPESQAATAVSFHYDPVGKRDPFLSYVRQLVSVDDEELTSPLQRFDLSQLVVTGIVWNTKRPLALVEDPTGKGYIVGRGAPIGKNRGRIVEIDDNRVIVKETYVDFEERATTKEVDMYLHERKPE